MSDYLVQEDGSSHLILEDSSGDLILETPLVSGNYFSSVGSLGTSSAKSSGETISMSPTSDVPVGNLIGVWVTWQSHYFFGPDGPQNEHHGCVDSVGNIYSTLVSWYIFDAYVGLFLTRVTTALTTSDSVEVTFFGTGAQTKAMSMWEFELAPDKNWAFMCDKVSGTGATLGDPPAVSVAGLPSQEYLMLHVLGAEGPNTDTYTWDSDYTEIDGAGTTGGSPDSNVHVRGGFRIATLTGDTVDVTSTTADRDVDNALCAICAIVPEPFPTAPILDDFNRADENPLDNSTWDTGTPPGFGTALMQIDTNVAASDGGSGDGSQYWLEEIEAEDAECTEIYVTLATQGDLNLYFLAAGAGGSATLTGGIVCFRMLSATEVGAAMIFGQAGDSGGSSSESIIHSWYELQDGDKIGGQFHSPILNLWFDRGAGWEWVSAYYFSSLIPDDYAATRRVAMGVQGDLVSRLDDFGASWHVCSRPFQQIIRRLWPRL